MSRSAEEKSLRECVIGMFEHLVLKAAAVRIG